MGLFPSCEVFIVYSLYPDIGVYQEILSKHNKKWQVARSNKNISEDIKNISECMKFLINGMIYNVIGLIIREWNIHCYKPWNNLLLIYNLFRRSWHATRCNWWKPFRSLLRQSSRLHPSCPVLRKARTRSWSSRSRGLSGSLRSRSAWRPERCRGWWMWVGCAGSRTSSFA